MLTNFLKSQKNGSQGRALFVHAENRYSPSLALRSENGPLSRWLNHTVHHFIFLMFGSSCKFFCSLF